MCLKLEMLYWRLGRGGGGAVEKHRWKTAAVEESPQPQVQLTGCVCVCGGVLGTVTVPVRASAVVPSGLLKEETS